MNLEELKTLRFDGGFGEGDQLKIRLYELCELIGDAGQWLYEPLETEELQKVRNDIAEMKAEFRGLIGVESTWEPPNGDWRMGCY
jgi:hypothetical protein